MARVLSIKGELESALERGEDSIRSLRQAATIWRHEKLRKDIRLIPNRARTLGLLAQTLAQSKDFVAANRVAEEMIEAWDEMPENSRFQFLSIYASSLLRGAEVILLSGRTNEARQALDHAEDVFESSDIGA